MNHYFYKFTKFTNGYFLYKKDMNHYIVNRKDKILKSVVLKIFKRVQIYIKIEKECKDIYKKSLDLQYIYK